MSVAVLDLCSSPPRLARQGHATVPLVEDSWVGKRVDGDVVWDGEPWREGVPGVPVTRPAARIESFPPQLVPAILTPLLTRCRKALKDKELQALALLVPIGLPFESARGLRRLAADVLGVKHFLVADAAPIMAAIAIWVHGAERACYKFVLERRDCFEGSCVHVGVRGNTIYSQVARQSRRSSPAEAEEAVGDGRHEATLVAKQHMDDLFRHTPEWLAQQLAGNVRLELSRAGIIGVRHGHWGLHALAPETMPPAAVRERNFEPEAEPVKRLEYWFGYPGCAVHPLAEVSLVTSRLEAPPKGFKIATTRLPNGSIRLDASWSSGFSTVVVPFPTLAA